MIRKITLFESASSNYPQNIEQLLESPQYGLRLNGHFRYEQYIKQDSRKAEFHSPQNCSSRIS